MEAKRRVQWIDAVKGVGIMLVIVAHIGPVGGSKLFWYLTYGFMPLFFVMAGFTSRPALGYGTQIWKKAKRLLVPYIVYGLVLLALSSLLLDDTRFSRALVGLVYGRYSLFVGSPADEYPLLHACPALCPLWFLPCMFMGYLCVIAYDNSGG